MLNIAGILGRLLRDGLTVLAVFIVTWAISLAGLYWLLGGYQGMLQGAGLIVILAPLAIAASVAKLVGAMIARRRGGDLAWGLARGLLNRAKDHPKFVQFQTTLRVHGVRVCVPCGNVEFKPSRSACSKCGAAVTAERADLVAEASEFAADLPPSDCAAVKLQAPRPQLHESLATGETEPARPSARCREVQPPPAASE